MYFPHTFPKVMLATNGIVETAGTASIAIAANQFALVDFKTNLSVALGAGTTAQNTPVIYLAQGSAHALDNLGGVVIDSPGSVSGNPFHGGYKESVKSQKIEPALIRRFIWIGATSPSRMAFNVAIVGTPAQFEANQSINGGVHVPNPGTLVQDGGLIRQEVYRLHLVLKGSPVYRLLNRPEYWDFDASTLCMPDGTVDRASLVTQWVTGINSHPIIKKLVTASSTNGGLTLVITDTYVDTDFSADPNYTKNDFIEREGIDIQASVYDERNVRCAADLFTYTPVGANKIGTGFGNNILQELILEKEYRDEPYHSDTRLRMVLDDTSLTDIDRTAKYGHYLVEFAVPRRRNGDSGLDTDYYLVKIVTAKANGAGAAQFGTRNAALEAFIPAYVASAGKTVALEIMTSVLA